MAEYVQQNMEEMLPELEQLQRVQLLTKDEVKQVIKMRRRFEYKIQKQTKKKEDFLNYIQYDSSLLSLLNLRRDKIGYEFKKNDIEYSISRRINKLFRILEHRFGNDIKIWMSHIEYLKNMNWNVELSKVLRRFIQAHTDKPQVWISAAKYELESIGNPDTSRKIMLEGLRFHPISRELFKEYFRLEIIYVDMLRKRSQILGIEGSGGISDEARDKVLDGEVVLTVLKMGVDAIHEVDFVASLLHVIASCENPSSFVNIKDRIIEILREDFSECYLTWDTLAREALFSDSPLSTVCNLYEEGFGHVQELDELEELMDCYIETILSIPSLLEGKELHKVLGSKLIQVFEFGHQKKILKEKFYSTWVSLINSNQESAKIISEASILFPSSVILLKESISLSLISEDGTSMQELIERFFKGIEKLPRREDVIPSDLLEFMFVNISSRNGTCLHDFYLKCRGGSSSWDKSVRLLYFDHLYTVKGIDAVRGFYDENRYEPPFDLDFHLKALEFEALVGSKVDKNRIRSIYEAATDQFGKDNIDIWLQFIDFETKNGKSLDVTSILERAEQSLQSKELKEKFIVRYQTR